MHPLIRQQLAADRNKEMIAKAGDWRRARQARRADRARTSDEGRRVHARWRNRLPRLGQVRGV
jgi:hypothetical protein